MLLPPRFFESAPEADVASTLGPTPPPTVAHLNPRAELRLAEAGAGMALAALRELGARHGGDPPRLSAVASNGNGNNGVKTETWRPVVTRGVVGHARQRTETTDSGQLHTTIVMPAAPVTVAPADAAAVGGVASYGMPQQGLGGSGAGGSGGAAAAAGGVGGVGGAGVSYARSHAYGSGKPHSFATAMAGGSATGRGATSAGGRTTAATAYATGNHRAAATAHDGGGGGGGGGARLSRRISARAERARMHQATAVAVADARKQQTQALAAAARAHARAQQPRDQTPAHDLVVRASRRMRQHATARAAAAAGDQPPFGSRGRGRGRGRIQGKAKAQHSAPRSTLAVPPAALSGGAVAPGAYGMATTTVSGGTDAAGRRLCCCGCVVALNRTLPVFIRVEEVSTRHPVRMLVCRGECPRRRLSGYGSMCCCAGHVLLCRCSRLVLLVPPSL